jgi:hypothetical protein
MDGRSNTKGKLERAQVIAGLPLYLAFNLKFALVPSRPAQTSIEVRSKVKSEIRIPPFVSDSLA